MKIYEKRFVTLLLTFFLLFTGYSFSNEAEDNRGPLFGWKTVVVAPMAKISIEGGDHSDSDAEEVVERFLRVLEDHGIRSRKATSEDERLIVISMRGMIGPDSSLLIRLQHQESARFLRDGEEVVGTASTWECETLSKYDRAFSTPWPKIEKAMKLLADNLNAAIHGTSNKPVAKQADDVDQPLHESTDTI